MKNSLIVNIDVDDLEKGTRFYMECFDLKIGRQFPEGWIELVGLEAPIYLLEKDEKSKPFEGAKEHRNFQRHWTPVHMDIAVPNIEVAFAKAKKAGAIVETQIENKKWGKIAMFSDPFGNGFCILEFTGRGYDEVTVTN